MTGKLSWWRRARTGREVATCREVGRVLQAYLDGHVDELTARRVARHLEMCRRCGMEASTYAEIKRSLAPARRRRRSRGGGAAAGLRHAAHRA